MQPTNQWVEIRPVDEIAEAWSTLTEALNRDRRPVISGGAYAELVAAKQVLDWLFLLPGHTDTVFGRRLAAIEAELKAHELASKGSPV